jgi:hypothetical protein
LIDGFHLLRRSVHGHLKRLSSLRSGQNFTPGALEAAQEALVRLRLRV